MKATKFSDLGVYTAELKSGNYLIDGNYVEINGYGGRQVEIKDIENVFPISRTTIVTHYIDADENVLSINDYRQTKDKLLSNRLNCDEEDGDIEWKTLEDEFKYRKFIETWNPITKNIESKGDPIRFEIIESVFDSGNPYILSLFQNGGNDTQIFVYDRYTAVLDIVKNKMAELGMRYEGNISYESTNKKKIWGNSTHSCIEYVTAFNGYIFNNRYDIKSSLRNTLDKCLAYYKKDKEDIETIIQNKYNQHFGHIDENKFDFELLLKDLENARNNLINSEVKVKYISTFNSAKNLILKSINQIMESYKVNKGD